MPGACSSNKTAAKVQAKRNLVSTTVFAENLSSGFAIWKEPGRTKGFFFMRVCRGAFPPRRQQKREARTRRREKTVRGFGRKSRRDFLSAASSPCVSERKAVPVGGSPRGKYFFFHLFGGDDLERGSAELKFGWKFARNEQDPGPAGRDHEERRGSLRSARYGLTPTRVPQGRLSLVPPFRTQANQAPTCSYFFFFLIRHFEV